MHGEEETDRDSVGDVIPSVVRLSSTSLASTSSSGSGSDPRPKTVTPTPGMCIESTKAVSVLTRSSYEVIVTDDVWPCAVNCKIASS
jgi:hypothetical protein